MPRQRSTTGGSSLLAAGQCACSPASRRSACSIARCRPAAACAPDGSASAGAATGCGIWATHFIAMLAYEPSVPVGYDVGLTIALARLRDRDHRLPASRSLDDGDSRARRLGGAVVARRHRGHALYRDGGAGIARPDRMVGRPRDRLDSPRHGVRRRRHCGSLRARARCEPTLSAACLLTLAIVSHHFTAMGAVDARSRSDARDQRARAFRVAARAHHRRRDARGAERKHPRRRHGPAACGEEHAARYRAEQHESRADHVRRGQPHDPVQSALPGPLPPAGRLDPARNDAARHDRAAHRGRHVRGRPGAAIAPRCSARFNAAKARARSPPHRTAAPSWLWASPCPAAAGSRPTGTSPRAAPRGLVPLPVRGQSAADVGVGPCNAPLPRGEQGGGGKIRLRPRALSLASRCTTSSAVDLETLERRSSAATTARCARDDLAAHARGRERDRRRGLRPLDGLRRAFRLARRLDRHHASASAPRASCARRANSCTR